jgi:hypothetical protein
MRLVVKLALKCALSAACADDFDGLQRKLRSEDLWRGLAGKSMFTSHLKCRAEASDESG